MKLLIVGSNANNGSHCGLSYSNSNNAFGNSNDNIGARLNITLKRKQVRISHWSEMVNTVAPVSMEG